jgi:23S rRNA (uracil1939-C5)-methyltransferase
LFCSVGTFTQPGFKANAALLHEVQKQIEGLLSKIGRRPPLRAIEFGSGIGNFTLPLTACFDEVHAFEVDSLALQGLERSLQSDAWKDLKIPESRLHIHRGNFQIKRSGPQKENVPFAQADLVLVDPPRSGLMSFLDPLLELAKTDLPQAFVYVSCFAESFATDLKRLSALGYRLEQLTIVDQFPQSRHYEIIAALRLG